MSLTVTKVDIWSSKIEDKPGGLAKVLAALGDAGASLECVIARRDSAKSGAGVVFLTPAKGAAVRKAAQSQGVAPGLSTFFGSCFSTNVSKRFSIFSAFSCERFRN
jgi:hypothetical protein